MYMIIYIITDGIGLAPDGRHRWYIIYVLNLKINTHIQQCTEIKQNKCPRIKDNNHIYTG